MRSHDLQKIRNLRSGCHASKNPPLFLQTVSRFQGKSFLHKSLLERKLLSRDKEYLLELEQFCRQGSGTETALMEKDRMRGKGRLKEIPNPERTQLKIPDRASRYGRPQPGSRWKLVNQNCRTLSEHVPPLWNPRRRASFHQEKAERKQISLESAPCDLAV
jgi:hypothetical protein